MTMQGLFTRVSFFRPSLCLLVLAVLPALASGRPPRLPATEGEELFTKTFSQGRAESGGGDGLGPLFNHVSCAACHRQGTIGGGGGIEFNVVLITAQLPSDKGIDDKTLVRSLQGLHLGFVEGGRLFVPTILLHRFGPDEQYFERKMSLGGTHVPLDLTSSERSLLQKQLSREPTPAIEKTSRIRLVRSQRNSTALFGAGLIDKIPDDVLYAAAERQAQEGVVSGRVPPIGHEKVGRFGWRGQKEHLHDFVLAACANELGLQVPGNPQPKNPLRPQQRAPGLDLTTKQCESLTAYVASLPAPREMPPRQTVRTEGVEKGRVLFTSIGCAVCHPEQLGAIQGIYSDLLLHDMGEGLADPASAEPTLTFVRHIPREEVTFRPQPQRLPSSRGYAGGSQSSLASLRATQPDTVQIKDPDTGGEKLFRVERSNLEAEWRTPPLWGVADSPPYLHDGRAETLADAIVIHGGEAEFSVKQYVNLELAERMQLMAFLQTLRAP